MTSQGGYEDVFDDSLGDWNSSWNQWLRSKRNWNNEGHVSSESIAMRRALVIWLLVVTVTSEQQPLSLNSFFASPFGVVTLNLKTPRDCALVLKSPVNVTSNRVRPTVCITYADVNRAFSKAQQTLRFDETQKLKVPTPSKQIAQTAEVILETTRILVQLFNLSRENIAHDLPHLDTGPTSISDWCPFHLRPIVCSPIGRYRRLDGLCNNLQNPHWGAAATPFVRYLDRQYADGISQPRASGSGGSLPNPRLLSNIIHKDIDRPDTNFTTMFMVFGQLLSHDISFVAQTMDSNFVEELCCDVSEAKRHSNCLPILVPSDDPFYSHHKKKCHEFIRSLAAQRVGCTLGPRDQINQLTSYIDGSFIYGSNLPQANSLRTFHYGLLKSNSTLKKALGLQVLLPARTDFPLQGCFPWPNSTQYCFEAGDKRVNENLLLAALHTVWLREHNRIALNLHRINPLWDDEKLYQETRHLVAAMIQHIVLHEYLPLGLGEDNLSQYQLLADTQGYFLHYNSSVNAGLSSNFMVAAFRFGHSQITSQLQRYNKYHQKIGSQKLALVTQQPYDLYQAGYLDEYLLGLLNQPSQSVDEALVDQVTNHLQQNPKHQFGLDLAAINILRGREHGVPGYNSWRKFCGLKYADSFDDLLDVLPPYKVEKFRRLYSHPDDIDLWSAGISERPMSGAVVGPTFACLLGRQFQNLRVGDRYWYENDGWLSSFSADQLNEIRKISLARIICDNSDDIETIQKWVMKLPHPKTNPQVHCKEIAAINLQKWEEFRFWMN